MLEFGSAGSPGDVDAARLGADLYGFVVESGNGLGAETGRIPVQILVDVERILVERVAEIVIGRGVAAGNPRVRPGPRCPGKQQHVINPGRPQAVHRLLGGVRPLRG